MKIKTKAWLVSQGVLVVTAVLIQLTFYREIKLGPLLGMTKRPYWEIIADRPPGIPDFIREKGLPPKLWDARLPLSEDEIRKANLGGHRRAHRREEGLRTAFFGGWMVNGLYFVVFHALYWYIPRQAKPRRANLAHH
ncbi:MAG: hypothetical protein CMI20_08420 [Opitutae bacterium]|nr:hypothetical protein [Opitutae bacterium]